MLPGNRLDPYKNFRFLVFFSDSPDPVAGISKVTGLKRTTEVVKHRAGGDPSSSFKSPGRTEYDPITLERGLTLSPKFEQWANKVWNLHSPTAVSLIDFRKDLRIEVHNEAGQPVLAYEVFRCWVSEFQAFSDLDANANAVLIEHIKLENEGWRRTDHTALPAGPEPSFVEPPA